MGADASDLRQVLIVGAGTMGVQVSLQCAAHGVDVRLHDIDGAGRLSSTRWTWCAHGLPSWWPWGSSPSTSSR